MLFDEWGESDLPDVLILSEGTNDPGLSRKRLSNLRRTLHASILQFLSLQQDQVILSHGTLFTIMPAAAQHRLINFDKLNSVLSYKPPPDM